ncbi:hypothetical protein HYR99_12950 [Candidatus Poribacteria bacterium]|nr:hypothetical protein [Candidatus Poribacteria bacterium]
MNNVNKFEPARNIDDAWAALDVVPLEPGDRRYVDCSQIRGPNTLNQIERMLNRHSQAGTDFHLLFTGYRGNGKTTELYQLQSRIVQKYEVIYFDAEEKLDLYNLALTDVLVTVARETVERMRGAGYRLPDQLLEGVGDWFFERVLEKSAEIATEAGAKAEIGIPHWVSFITAKVFSSLKTNTADREIMRRQMERNITELIEKVNNLLRAARAQVRSRNKTDLLFIMDSLDRLPQGSDKNLFLAGGGLLKELKGNFIYVVPISLLYDEQATLLPFDQRIILPMIPIYKRGVERNPNESSIAQLRNLISQRVVLEEIFTQPEETVRELIIASGGHLRDLMRLMRLACDRTGDKITPDDAKAAVNILIRDYERVVLDEEYRHLIKAYQTQSPLNDKVTQKLIYNNVILVYQESDETDWKDVHPAVVRNMKFQGALREG